MKVVLAKPATHTAAWHSHIRERHAPGFEIRNDNNFTNHFMNHLDLLQWPAMIVTVIASWLVTSLSKRKREIGFWCFLLSNVLWVVWGYHDHAYALIALQLALAIMNIRGAMKNDPEASSKNNE
jgi:hypothetical protein